MSGTERRTQILAVARDLFAEGGYRTTTADVAAAAGVSDALVVKHFGTKEALFRAAIVEPLFELVEQGLLDGRQWALDNSPGDPVDHRALLIEFGRTWVGLVIDQRDVLLSLARESAAFPDDAARMLVLARDLVDDLARVLERLASTPAYRDFKPSVTVYATLGALTIGGLMAEDPDAFIEELCDMTLFGVLSEEGRRAFDP